MDTLGAARENAELLLAGSKAFEDRRSVLDRKMVKAVVEKLMQPHVGDQYGVRKITNEKFETPDPERPLQVTLPNGKQKWLIGLSGQNILLADSLSELVTGGVRSVEKIELYNRNGHLYGGEIDPATGHKIGYAFDSSTWDIAVVKVQNENGGESLKVLAGALADDASGKPSLINQCHTRQRVIFDAAFEEVEPGQYRLVARNPRTPFNVALPRDGNWVDLDENGVALFRHGYGGGPVTLGSGELFVDEQGRVPFVHEVVWEQKLVPIEGSTEMRKTPYRTVIAVTYMDRTLSRILGPTTPIFDVYKPSGEIWSAAGRPHWGPLVEGGHIDVRFQGRMVRSMADVEMIRQSGGVLDFQMLFSAGEYYAHYGSFLAHSRGDLHSFEPVLGENGELYDITEPLKALFTWLGRPVSFSDEQGQEFILVHGVDRSSVPESITLDQMLTEASHWVHFNRNLLVFPIERSVKDGVSRIHIKDNTGLLEYLSHFKPRREAEIRAPAVV